MNYKNIFDEAHSIRRQSSYGRIDGGLLVLILDELRHINSKLEDIVDVHTGVDSTKTEAMREVEAKFGKSIERLLSEREANSIRAIADELGVSKSTISKWTRTLSNSRHANTASDRQEGVRFWL